MKKYITLHKLYQIALKYTQVYKSKLKNSLPLWTNRLNYLITSLHYIVWCSFKSKTNTKQSIS